jgi:hypothetical protein
VAFNGHESKAPDAKYLDCINGQGVYDVTSVFDPTGDNVALINSTQSRSDFAYYGTVLIVVYESASEPYRQIWVNEGSDCLLYPPATGYTMFYNVSTTDVVSAKLTTVLDLMTAPMGMIYCSMIITCITPSLAEQILHSPISMSPGFCATGQMKLVRYQPVT